MLINNTIITHSLGCFIMPSLPVNISNFAMLSSDFIMLTGYCIQQHIFDHLLFYPLFCQVSSYKNVSRKTKKS